MDRGPWWATVPGVIKTQTQLRHGLEAGKALQAEGRVCVKPSRWETALPISATNSRRECLGRHGEKEQSGWGGRNPRGGGMDGTD